MSKNARIFFVGSILVTGITVLGVNYYINEEKTVIQISYKDSFFVNSFFQRKRANIYIDISRREEKHRLNMDQYEKQLQIEEKLRLRDK